MLTLPVDDVPDSMRPTAVYAAATLHAIARDKAAGRRTPRLTEPRQATWQRFKGRLGPVDLVRLLLEDAAVLHRVPFDPALAAPDVLLDGLPAKRVQGWLDAIGSLDLGQPGAEYIGTQARLLGLPTRLARHDLHQVKPHHQVLELPGTGGQLAHHIVSTQRDIYLQSNFAVACDGWRELTLAGLVALDLGAPNTDFAVWASAADLRDPNHPLRARRYDFVVGLATEKGNPFTASRLEEMFPTAKVLLV